MDFFPFLVLVRFHTLGKSSVWLGETVDTLRRVEVRGV